MLLLNYHFLCNNDDELETVFLLKILLVYFLQMNHRLHFLLKPAAVADEKLSEHLSDTFVWPFFLYWITHLYSLFFLLIFGFFFFLYLSYKIQREHRDYFLFLIFFFCPFPVPACGDFPILTCFGISVGRFIYM